MLGGFPEYRVFDRSRNRVWRHRAPTGGHLQLDDLTASELPLPAGLGVIDLTEIF
jgi:hypothetical protein